MPLLAVSDYFFEDIWSRYHQDRLVFDKTAQQLISWQHFTFIPLLMVAKFGEAAWLVSLLKLQTQSPQFLVALHISSKTYQACGKYI